MKQWIWGKRRSLKRERINTNEEIGHVRYTRGFGRKKVVISKDRRGSVVGSSASTSRMKKPCRKKSIPDAGLSVLEALPKEEVAVTAKESHFVYNTPSEAQPVLDVGNLSDCKDVEKPKAHGVSRYRSPLNEEALAAISADLFHSTDGEETWPKKDYF